MSKQDKVYETLAFDVPRLKVNIEGLESADGWKHIKDILNEKHGSEDKNFEEAVARATEITAHLLRVLEEEGKIKPITQMESGITLASFVYLVLASSAGLEQISILGTSLKHTARQYPFLFIQKLLGQ